MSGEADAFLDILRQDVKDKILYNVDKVANGHIDKDLFKKLESTDIWEFCTLYKGIQKVNDMEAVTFHTLDEIKDKHIGKVDTAHRDKYEAELQSFFGWRSHQESP